ncbi:DUF6883 domain-containing protein [Sphaerotilus mobilis]|uniref:DUF6883 domain-containing protein n=1 Tax=Sphaerotilus mobilis TaxID=47994 RepID=A0A4Q7LFR6_9BURK|nr:DUF6883 domain-containing protein [Sphaerotilus mobilis]RZS53014.1 hypothetical protein EV685_2637 [Sphaerotilus mobilis]
MVAKRLPSQKRRLGIPAIPARNGRGVKTPFVGMGWGRGGRQEWVMPHPDALPNHDRAVIPEAKLSAYALNPDHEVGRHKARVFHAVLGMDQAQARQLETAIRDGLPQVPATRKHADQHGQRYVADVPVTGPAGTAMVRTCWIVRETGGVPQLTSVYVKEEQR